MKNLILIFFAFAPLYFYGQISEYNVTSYLEEGNKAPNTHYIGEAWLNSLFRADEDLDYNITKATFSANSTLDWHKHASPQILIVVEGVGYYQERGREPIFIRVGDVIKCDKNIEHWHSSSKEKNVTYLALYGGDRPTTWTEVLTQEDYDSVAEKLKVK